MSTELNSLSETYPPLSSHEAALESNRCLYCFDAPCTQACPSHIDIPSFIRKISSGNVAGSAKTILQANLLGATCARVCPVQELCEGACVLGADHKPIAIGRLQRFSTDYVARMGMTMFHPGPSTGMRVAVVGSGPASLSCAGELAKLGNDVSVFEKRNKPGGLSTYGIISLREPTEIAIAEAKMVECLGVKFTFGTPVDGPLVSRWLKGEFDAVFLGVGLGPTPRLGIAGEELVVDGLDYIEKSKEDPSGLHVGNDVLVIGAGNTAIDCATIAKRLGAKTVTIVYRRYETEMTAYPHEYEFIKNEGVRFEFLSQPVEVLANDGQVQGLRCIRMALGDRDATGRRVVKAIAGSEFDLKADQVVKAIGQTKPKLAEQLKLRTVNGFIVVNDEMETRLSGVFSGGDCIRSGGAASTVKAVQDGKIAAKAIHRRLTGVTIG